MKQWLSKNWIRILLNVIVLIIIIRGIYINSSKPYSDGNQVVSHLYIAEIILLNTLFLVGAYINTLVLIPRYLLKLQWYKYLMMLLGLFLVTTVSSSIFWDYIMTSHPKGCQCNYSNLPIYINNKSETFNLYFRTFPHVTFYMLIFSAGYFVQFIIRQARTKQLIENHQKETELMVLKSQVNPHFLFNMMNTIYSLSLKKADETPEIVLKLSEILRYNLYETNTAKVLLEKELNIVENYIDLEKIRLKQPEKVTFENQIQNPMLKIAPLLLLPLVENAFKHGIDSKIRQGFVAVKATESNGEFIFACQNNYLDQKKSKKHEAGGLGLQNLKQRLELIYPDLHQLQIDNHQQIFNVTLTIKLK